MNPLTLSLSTASDLLRAREISALELTDFFLARIEQLNPTLNSFITVTGDQARDDARNADENFSREVDRGALHGIPLALKDLFDTRGVRTTAGSKILRERIPSEDADVVTRLHTAGAVLLGKLNLHEWAYGVTNDNPHFGRAANPWNVERVTGGSSGGSAVAVAARLCVGALGSDTGGSIRIPAALCGVTGLKPTYGRVSLRGVIPLSWSMDHVGPLAQSAEDVALMLQAIAGYDALDPASVDVSVPDYNASLNQSLKGIRVAQAGGYFNAQVDEEILAGVESGTRVLAACGATRVEKEMPFAEELFLTNRVALGAEAAVFHSDNLEAHAEDYGADVLKRLQNGAATTTADYVRARRRQARLIRALEIYFNDVDLLVTPTTRVVAPLVGEDAVMMSQHLTALTAPFNLTGFPAISIPCGFSREGLPIGLQLVARKWDEALLLQAAYQYQRVTDWHTRVPPIAK